MRPEGLGFALSETPARMIGGWSPPPRNPGNPGMPPGLAGQSRPNWQLAGLGAGTLDVGQAATPAQQAVNDVLPGLCPK